MERINANFRVKSEMRDKKSLDQRANSNASLKDQNSFIGIGSITAAIIATFTGEFQIATGAKLPPLFR
jgi:hypothetical protein